MPAPSPDRRTIRFVDIHADRVRLRTAVRGSGRPLLLITGLGASLDLGAPFERELAARGVQTVSFDAPGIGQSTPYTWPRRLPGVARTVERMLDALGYQRVDVLGASLGGVIAQQFAHQAPHRVRRLVLAATRPGLGGIPGSPRARPPRGSTPTAARAPTWAARWSSTTAGFPAPAPHRRHHPRLRPGMRHAPPPSLVTARRLVSAGLSLSTRSRKRGLGQRLRRPRTR